MSVGIGGWEVEQGGGWRFGGKVGEEGLKRSMLVGGDEVDYRDEEVVEDDESDGEEQEQWNK
jgi:hypothetical protein